MISRLKSPPILVPYFRGVPLFTYAKNTAIDIHIHDVRQNGENVYQDHLLPIVLNFDFFGITDKRSRTVGKIAGFHHDGPEDHYKYLYVVDPYVRSTRKTGSICYNDLWVNAGEIGQEISYVVYKVTKDGNNIKGYIHKLFNIRNQHKHLDLLAILLKLSDIDSNSNPDENFIRPRPGYLADCKEDFLAKKVRKSIDVTKTFIPQFKRILRRNKDFKYNNQIFYDWNAVKSFIEDIECKIERFITSNNFTQILNNNWGLGSSAQEALEYYQKGLEHFFERYPQSFDEKPCIYQHYPSLEN